MFQNSLLIAGQARFPIIGDRIHKLGTDWGANRGSLFKTRNGLAQASHLKGLIPLRCTPCLHPSMLQSFSSTHNRDKRNASL